MPKRPTLASFTLVEMLVVIAIIAILAGLILYAATGVMRQAARSRARSEIAGLSAAMESYKSDNGVYPTPTAATFADTNASYKVSPAGPNYESASETVFQSLSGLDPTGVTPLTPTAANPSAGKVYMTFKKAQLGTDTGANVTGNVYIQDPFGNSYGYFNGNATTTPINGTNAFDLWSTAGDMAGTNQPGWVSNWGS